MYLTNFNLVGTCLVAIESWLTGKCSYWALLVWVRCKFAEFDLCRTHTAVSWSHQLTLNTTSQRVDLCPLLFSVFVLLVKTVVKENTQAVKTVLFPFPPHLQWPEWATFFDTSLFVSVRSSWEKGSLQLSVSYMLWNHLLLFSQYLQWQTTGYITGGFIAKLLA